MLSDQTLRAVLAVSETKSFRRAAERLQISPPSVTRLINRAERMAEFQIFERSRSGATLTPQGRRFAEQCSNLLQAVGNFGEAIEDIRGGNAAALTIGCGPLTTQAIVYPMAEYLLDRWPDLEIKVKVQADIDPIHELREHKLDLFIGDLTHTTAYEFLDVVKLRRKPMIVVAHPGHAIHKIAPCSLADLTRFPLAMPHFHRYWRKTFESAINARPGSARLQQVICDDFDLLVRFAEGGRFICGGSPESFADSLSAGRLKEVPLVSPVYWNICCARLQAPGTEQNNRAWAYLNSHWADSSHGRK